MSEVAPIDHVRALETALLAQPQVDLLTQMFAHGGIGARTIMIPAGTALNGALTRISNICIVSGDISVTTDNGLKRLTGFNVISAEAGAKRAGYAHSDTWWTTVWRTDETESVAMENEMTEEAEMLQTRRLGIEFAAPRQTLLEG